MRFAYSVGSLLILSASALAAVTTAACGSSTESPAIAAADAGAGEDSSPFTTGDNDAAGGDGSVNGPSCATAEALASREPVYIDIILDGSRSMDGHGSTSAGCDNAY